MKSPLDEVNAESTEVEVTDEAAVDDEESLGDLAELIDEEGEGMEVLKDGEGDEVEFDKDGTVWSGGGA